MVLIVVPSYSLTSAFERRGALRPGPLTGTRRTAPRTIALVPPAIRKEDPWNDATAGR